MKDTSHQLPGPWLAQVLEAWLVPAYSHGNQISGCLSHQLDNLGERSVMFSLCNRFCSRLGNDIPLHLLSTGDAGQ